MKYELRQYQVKMVDEARTALARGGRRILMSISTGAGKTLISLRGIVEPAVAKGQRILFCCPRRELVKQTSNKLDELGLHAHGVIMGTHWRNRPMEPVQVASVDTIVNRLDRVGEFELIVLDEAHHATNDPKTNYAKVLARWPKATVIGLTATPVRLDGKGMGRVFDTLILGPTIKQLIHDRWLKQPVVFRGPKLDFSKIRKCHGDWNQRDLGEMMDQPRIVGDLISEWKDKAENRPTVVFPVNVANSKHYVEQYIMAGIPSAHIDAHTPEKERDRIIKDFREGHIKCLASVGVVSEGFDVPIISCVQFVRPTESVGLYIQTGGRGLRPDNLVAREDENCIILDHASLTWRHGPLDIERQWSLEDGLCKEDEERRWECPKCEFPFTELREWPRQCPKCNALLVKTKQEQFLGDFEPEAIDTSVRLTQMTAEEKVAFEKHNIEIRQSYYKKMAEICYERNMTPIQANLRFKFRFKSWPSTLDRATSQHPIVWVTDANGKKSPQWERKGEAHEQPLVESQTKGV